MIALNIPPVIPADLELERMARFRGGRLVNRFDEPPLSPEQVHQLYPYALEARVPGYRQPSGRRAPRRWSQSTTELTWDMALRLYEFQHYHCMEADWDCANACRIVDTRTGCVELIPEGLFQLPEKREGEQRAMVDISAGGWAAIRRYHIGCGGGTGYRKRKDGVGVHFYWGSCGRPNQHWGYEHPDGTYRVSPRAYKPEQSTPEQDLLWDLREHRIKPHRSALCDVRLAGPPR